MPPWASLFSCRAPHPTKGATIAPCRRTRNQQNACFLPRYPTVRGLWLRRHVYDFAPDSTHTSFGTRGFVDIVSSSTGQKVAIPALCKNPTRIMRSPMWYWRWKKPAVPFPRLFLGLALTSSTSVRTGFFLSHTVRRQGDAVFRGYGEEASAKLSLIRQDGRERGTNLAQKGRFVCAVTSYTAKKPKCCGLSGAFSAGWNRRRRVHHKRGHGPSRNRPEP